MPLRTSDSTPAARRFGHLFARAAPNAINSHYNIRSIVDIYATTQDRDLGGVAADVQKIVDDARGELPKGSTLTIRGQVATMQSAYYQLLIGLAFFRCSDLSSDCCKFSVLARPLSSSSQRFRRHWPESCGCCSSRKRAYRFPP